MSGLTVDGLLESELTGPTLLSGGEFGVEASIFALVLGLGTGSGSWSGPAARATSSRRSGGGGRVAGRTHHVYGRCVYTSYMLTLKAVECPEST